MPAFAINLNLNLRLALASLSKKTSPASLPRPHLAATIPQDAIKTLDQLVCEAPDVELTGRMFFSQLTGELLPEAELNIIPTLSSSASAVVFETLSSLPTLMDRSVELRRRTPFPSARPASTCSSSSCYSTDSFLDEAIHELPTLSALSSLPSLSLLFLSSEESLVSLPALSERANSPLFEPFSPSFEFESDTKHCHWSQPVGQGKDKYWPECRVYTFEQAVARAMALARLNESGQRF